MPRNVPKLILFLPAVSGVSYAAFGASYACAFHLRVTPEFSRPIFACACVDMQSEGGRPEARCRKPRKGTRSCWECKRRKIRCSYASPTDAVCISCSRRCTKCVSQELPDQTTTPTARSRLVGDRIGRVEALVQELVKQASTGSAASDSLQSKPGQDVVYGCGDMPTPATSETPASHSAPPYCTSVVSGCPPPIR